MGRKKDQSIYSIGAVASLTNLSPSTIRTWERRYAALEPERTPGGGRRYSDEDVERLQLLKGLTGLGETISVVAPLSMNELRERMRQHQDRPDPESGTLRVALLHRSLGAQLAAAATVGVEVAHDARSAEQLTDSATSDSPVDVLLVEFPLLGSEPVDALEEMLDATGASDAIIEYRFARREQLRALTAAGARVVRGPATVDELMMLARAQGRARRTPPRPSLPSKAPPAAARRFDGVQLARLREVVPNFECECPNHLATLVTALQSFEDYCHRCIEDNPDDVDMHTQLATGTGRARAQLEDLLVVLCEHDGIPL